MKATPRRIKSKVVIGFSIYTISDDMDIDFQIISNPTLSITETQVKREKQLENGAQLNKRKMTNTSEAFCDDECIEECRVRDRLDQFGTRQYLVILLQMVKSLTNSQNGT